MRGIFTAGHIVVVLLTGLFLSLLDYELALGQGQPQQPSFLPYKNPNLGIGIQYPSDWELQEESNDKLRFIKQEGFVTADLNVENLDDSATTLTEYASTRVNELQEQRPEFQLISNEPTTISSKPAQKIVYTFEREEDGKTNKVMRIWSTNEGKLYNLAYIAESSQYDQYLPTFQKMVDSFNLDTSGSSTGSATQVQSGDRNSDSNNGRSSPTPPVNGDRNCDPSYPTVCIKSPPPQLNCDGVPYKDFKVTGKDPHGFDGDKDGIGCDSATGVEDASSATPSPTPTPQLNSPLTLTPTLTPTDICYRPGIGDWWENPDCKDYLENKYKKCPEGTQGTPHGCVPIADYCYLPGIGDWWDNPDCKDFLENKYKTIAPSPPSLSPPCPPNAEGNEVCPPSDELTPVPPTDGSTPVPGPPPPECPEAGPDVCGKDTPPTDEEPPDSDSDADDGNGNGDVGGDGNGEDGSNGDGDDNEGEEGGGNVPPFG